MARAKSIPSSSPRTRSYTKKRNMTEEEAAAEHVGKRVNVAGGKMEEEDTVTILAAVADFRARKGFIPTPTTMDEVLEAVNGRLHQDKDISSDQLYSKFRNLKKRYRRALDRGVGPTPFHRTFFDLSVLAWGGPNPQTKRLENEDSKADEEEEELVGEETGNECGDKGKDVMVVAAEEQEKEDLDEQIKKKKKKKNKKRSREVVAEEEVEEIRKMIRCGNFLPLSRVTMELGLKLMDKSRGEVLERKWLEFHDQDLRVKAKGLELQREVAAALADALKHV